MMKTRILLTILLSLPVLAWSQPDAYGPHNHNHRHRGKAAEKVQRLDSVVYILRDGQTGQDVPDYVFVYSYGKGMDDPREVIKYGLPERDLINKQLYTYDREGFKSKYLYQEWIDASWTDRMLVEYSPNAIGKTDREIYSSPATNGSWQPYQRHIYTYDGQDRIAQYLRSMYDAARGWYDFSENIWTFGDGEMLLQRVEKRVADDWIIWTEAYYYGDGEKPTERIRQTMRYDPASRITRLTNDSRHLYFYDEFGDPVVAEQYRWVNNGWDYVGKSLYYYSFIPGRKVALCHNGHTISVAPQAVRAHLAHGDCLGPCDDESDRENCRPGNGPGNQEKYSKVFPNPASGHFELQLLSGHPFMTAELISSAGSVVRSQDVASRERVVFEVSGLKRGQYVLRLEGGSETEETIVIIR
jgi:hypothetical protein